MRGTTASLSEVLGPEAKRQRLTSNMRDLRRRRKALGLCHCGQPRMPGRKQCEEHYRRFARPRPLSGTKEGPTITRELPAYVRLSLQLDPACAAEWSCFAGDHEMSIDDLIREAVECYMETARVSA